MNGCGEVCGECHWFKPYRCHFNSIPPKLERSHHKFLWWEYTIAPDTFDNIEHMIFISRLNHGNCEVSEKVVEKHVSNRCAKWRTVYE